MADHLKVWDGHGVRAFADPTFDEVVWAQRDFIHKDGPNAKGNTRVYFIWSPELRRVKIGWSEKTKLRLKNLQGASGMRLQLIGTIDGGRSMEKVLHERFADYRILGEWFSAEILPDLYELIAEDREWFAASGS